MNWRSLRNPGFITAFLLMGAAGVGIKTGIDRFNIYLQKKPIYAEPGPGGEERILRGIPSDTSNWQQMGQDRIVPPEELEVLGTENYLTRDYFEKHPRPNARPRRVELHAAYYTNAIDTVPHVAERCFTGAGMSLTGGPWVLPMDIKTTDWVPVADPPEGRAGCVFTTRLSNEYSLAGGGRRVTLPIDLTPEQPLKLRVTRYTTPKGDSYFAGYFFLGNGGWVSSAEEVRMLSFDLRQDYAYYAKVQFGSSDVSTPEELAELAGSLMTDLLGEIMTCVPDWMKVERGEWPPDNPKRPTAKK
jgi:hypothetical protein